MIQGTSHYKKFNALSQQQQQKNNLFDINNAEILKA